MYCPKCGTFNDNENIWCINCGHGKLPTAFVRSQTIQQPQTIKTPDGVQTAAEVISAFATEEKTFVNEENNIAFNPSSCVGLLFYLLRKGRRRVFFEFQA